MKLDFLDIINNNKGLLYKVCNLYCSDIEDRKDLFQEILLQLWKSHQSYKGESKFNTWMYRVALNTAIIHFKKKQREKTKIPVDFEKLEIPDLLRDSSKEEQIQSMYRAIDSLDRIEKSIIFLYLEDKSYAEITEITGLSKSNVGVKLNRIKTKLSNILKRQESWNLKH